MNEIIWNMGLGGIIINKKNTNNKIVIFGASYGGEKLYRDLLSLNQDIDFFVDNDTSKWGKELLNKKIFPPEELLKSYNENCVVLIGSSYITEIYMQLKEMKIEKIYKYPYEFLFGLIKQDSIRYITKAKNYNFKNINNDRKRYMVLLPGGFVLGGIEVWTKKLIDLLIERNREVLLYNLKNDYKKNHIFESIEESIIHYPFEDKMHLRQRVESAISSILIAQPSVLIIQRSEEYYMASSIIKENINISLTIIGVLHSNFHIDYDQSSRYYNIVDKFICVSDEIKNALCNIIPDRREDIYSLAPAISANIVTARLQRPYDIPLKLAYVGRLEIQHKRADLLIYLIKKLEEKNIKFQFYIVGSGNYAKELDAFIENSSSKNEIYMLGELEHEKIYEFWTDKYILVNVSNLEGTSIAMLEGLINGAVPVVTNVSGVKKFITDNENGFIVDIGDIDTMAERIDYLDKNRDILELFSKRASKIVKEICDSDKFIDTIIEICEK